MRAPWCTACAARQPSAGPSRGVRQHSLMRPDPGGQVRDVTSPASRAAPGALSCAMQDCHASIPVAWGSAALMQPRPSRPDMRPPVYSRACLMACMQAAWLQPEKCWLCPPTCVLLVHGLEGVGRLGAGACADDEQAGRHRVQRPRVAHLQGTGSCFWQVCDAKQIDRRWVRRLRETHLQCRSGGLLNCAVLSRVATDGRGVPEWSTCRHNDVTVPELGRMISRLVAVGQQFLECPPAGTSAGQ